MLAIHEFLVVVGTPTLVKNLGFKPEDGDPMKAMQEVYRVTTEEAALMAIIDGRLVGTLGVFFMPLYFLKDGLGFFTDRWWFVLPEYENSEVGRALKREAEAIAVAAGSFFKPWPKLKRPTPANDVARQMADAEV